MGELNTRMTIEDFVANLSSEYYNLIRQKIRLRNLRSTLDLSKERLRIVEERYYIGSMSRLDLQQAQVDFNSDSSKVLNQLEVVHTSRIRLNELMALNNVEEEIQIKDSLIYPNPFLDEVDLWKNTLEANASLLIAQIVAAQENYRIAIDRYKLGELSGIELREAQNSLLEAEERLSVAEYSTKICEISLLQLSGQILTYIRPEPEKASF